MAKVIDKKSIVAKGMYFAQSKLYNEWFARAVYRLPGLINYKKVIALDTHKRITVNALTAVGGLLPKNVFIPNHNYNEFYSLKRSRLCVATNEELETCLHRHAEQRTKICGFLFDNGGTINTQKRLIERVFMHGLFGSDGVFAMTTTRPRYMNITDEGYNRLAQKTVANVVVNNGYTLTENPKTLKYGRTYYQQYLLTRANN